MSNKISKFLNYAALSACLIGAGCASDRQGLSSIEQVVIDSAPSTKEKQKEMRKIAENISYFSLDDAEKKVYENIEKLKKGRGIKKEDFTNSEWEALKRYYGLKSPNEMTPEQYILLMRITRETAQAIGF